MKINKMGIWTVNNSSDTKTIELVNYSLGLAETIYLLDQLFNNGRIGIFATHEEEIVIDRLKRHSTNAAYYVLDYIRGESYLKKELEVAFQVIEKYKDANKYLP